MGGFDFHFSIDLDHPSLAGHFSGNPIVPGALILNHVIDASHQIYGEVSQIISVKFLQPLLPAVECTISYLPQGNNVAFEVISVSGIISKGVLKLSSPVVSVE